MEAIATVQPEPERTYLTRKRLTEAAADARWLIQCGASVLGERGVSASLLEMLKRGCPDGPSGVPSDMLYSDAQTGFGLGKGLGTVARARRCQAVWRRLPALAQVVLLARYESRQWPPGLRARLGDVVGVVALQQAGKAAERRSREAEHALESARGALEDARGAALGVVESELSGVRWRVRSMARRICALEASFPARWRTDWGPEHERELTGLAERLRALEERSVALAAETGADIAERDLGLAVAAVGALEADAQEVIADSDLFELVKTAQLAAQTSKDGLAAARRCEAWCRSARRATDRALACWVDAEEATEAGRG